MSNKCANCGLNIAHPTVIFYCPTCDTLVCRKCNSNHIRHNKKQTDQNQPEIIPKQESQIQSHFMPPIDIIVQIRNYQKYAGCRDTIKIANEYYSKFAPFLTEQDKNKIDEALELMHHTNEYRATSIVNLAHAVPIDRVCDLIVENIKKKAGM